MSRFMLWLLTSTVIVWVILSIATLTLLVLIARDNPRPLYGNCVPGPLDNGQWIDCKEAR